MWEKASEKVREAYKLDDLLSFVIKPSEFRWPPGKELMPVVKAMEHAIRSPFPNDRYLVCGRAIRIRFVDEFVVCFFDVLFEFCKLNLYKIILTFNDHMKEAF